MSHATKDYPTPRIKRALDDLQALELAMRNVDLDRGPESLKADEERLRYSIERMRISWGIVSLVAEGVANDIRRERGV
jgi:hypothetical protein